MQHYRAYLIGNDGHFVKHEVFESSDDESAVERAKQLFDGHDLEVWTGVRMVARVGDQSKPL